MTGGVHRPGSVEEAVRLLADPGRDVEPVAGGTWVMRARLREQAPRAGHVLLAGIPGLGDVRPGNPTVLGALVTHTELARLLDARGPLAAVQQAAAASAFPAVRNVATVGGNLYADPFPEADLLPALLAADAQVEVAGPGGRSHRPVGELVARVPRRSPGELAVSVRVPAPEGRRSGFARLTVRGGGEYSLASVALSVDVGPDGTVSTARLAVGSVEERARRCPAAEAFLAGRRLDPAAAEDAGRAAAAELRGRDGVDAPGWYRLAVLPALVRRAAGSISG